MTTVSSSRGVVVASRLTTMITMIMTTIVVVVVVVVEGVPVDVALNRPITAYTTCGSLGPEEYISQLYLWSSGDVRINNTFICYNSSIYPPTAMVDGNYTTWWQSTARPNFNQSTGGPDVAMNIDLQQVFEMQVITLVMGESLRPRRIVLYKSSTDLNSMQPWIYRVQSEQNCTKLYGIPAGTSNVVAVDSKLCQVYLTGPLAMNEALIFDLTQVTVPNWRNGRYLRIEFYDIDLTLGIVGIPFQHYTVRTLTIMAECTCNGQQIACSQSNITGTFECVCGNNTQGTNCDSCLPFYNQFAYKYGTRCESCNCFNHSSVCIFDQNVANAGGSLNALGIRVGGGVCQNCAALTTGINCELCLPLYYRPAGVLQISATPCVPCTCSGPGMQVTGLIGDCVMNDSAVIGMMPGDCYCKRNVVGSQCDRCRDGSYNMSPTNPDGCQDCGCVTNGTVGGSVICNATGQCNCKQFVVNLHCDTCKDGYYGLDPSKPDGCTICSCDVGGSLPSGCSKDIGACTCRPGITSTTCNVPAFGYYYPDLHFISGEFENLRAPWDTAQTGFFGFGYVTTVPLRPVSTVVTPPLSSSFSDQYQTVIRYSSSAAGTGTISIAGINTVTTMTLNMTFPACPAQWCYAPLGIVGLPKGLASTVTVTVTGATDPRLLLDRLITIPVEYLNTTNLFGPTDGAIFQSTCNVISNGVMASPLNQQYCQSRVFSLATYYLNGALPCNCNFLGSYSNGSCTAYGGQCSCKPGTTGRMCDSCQIQFYGLTSLGCQACNCSNTAFKACDNFGQCLCPPGVEGTSCDRCMASYYSYDYLRGCTPCDCNSIGSMTPFCNTTTGFCSCRSGVVGTRCDQCADGFWQMSVIGCSQCSCDSDGSLNSLCDKGSGQCTCKKNVQNQQCTSCISTAFAKSPSHIDGCLSCTCMGITNICQSAMTFFQQTTPPLPLFNISQMAQITLVTSTLFPLANGIVRQVISGLEMAETQVKATQIEYWQAPTLTGNLLQYYEGTISFTISWVSTAGVLPLSNLRLLLIGRNNAQFLFAFPIVSVPANDLTSVNVVLSLENVIAAGQTTATRGQLLMALTQVQGVLIPANYAPQDHVSRIGNLMYTMNPVNVEQCFCPSGYEGLSCENCSTGFMKANASLQGYLGYCVPCSCNSHSQLCIPDTGQCINCMDNTAGPNCEVCAPGFFRDSLLPPTSPCSPCPCWIPRVTNASCAILNGSVTCLQCNPGYTGNNCDSCLPFYYGNPQIQYIGSCTPCTCNGNTNSCDGVTGLCLNCSFNTDGPNCGKCKDGWFGAASSQNCTACGCNTDGSLSPICNNQTGQCSCISGVGRRTCDQCLDFYYHPFDPTINAPSKGCIPCNCSALGSNSLTCDANGVCSCKPLTTGVKCDTCQAGSFGLPQLPCQPCNCSVLGSDPAHVSQCDSLSGQCRCLYGVTGRRCETCMPMYYNMTPFGCTACGDCETSLGNDTIALLATFQGYWNQTLVFQMIQQQDSYLFSLQGMVASLVNHTGVLSGQGDLVTNLSLTVQTLLQSANTYSGNVGSLKSRMDDIALRSSQLFNDSLVQYARIHAIKTQADTVRVATGAQYVNVQNNIQTLLGYNTSAYQLLLSLQGRPLNLTWNWSGLFNTESQQALNELTLSLNSLNNAIQFNNSVASQVTSANALQTVLQQISISFATLGNTIGSLNSNSLSIAAKLSAVLSKYNITLSNKLNADNLWASVQATIAATDSILRQGQTSLTTGQQYMTDCQTIINGMTSGVLPIDTTVDLTGITGWNQAYNLVLTQLQLISTSLNSYTVAVSNAERKANELSQQAQSILITFQSVQSRGQPAVDAINGFLTIVQLLDQALQMALAANYTMQQILNQIQSVSISNMELSANQTLAASIAIKQSLDTLLANVTASNLNGQLDSANASLQNAIQSWALLDIRLAAFNAALTGLQAASGNLTLDADLSAGNAACDAALQQLTSVVTQNNILQSSVASQSAAVANMASSVANATLMQSQVAANVTAFQNQLNNIAQFMLLGINSSQTEVVSLQPILSQGLDALVAKLQAVQVKMAALEQPVSFVGTSYESITNPDSGTSRLYNSVGLDFISNQLKGVIFFAENTLTREKVLVQLVNSTIVFEYSNVDVTNTAISPATLEVGVWYRVYATRFAYDGQLTVIRMMTGGTAVTPMRTVSTTNTQLTLNSPLYIGGLLLSAGNIPKVYDSGIPFSGCVYNIIYNGAPVPLWQSILRKDSTATCCRKPAPIPSASTVSPCITLYGFGFISFNPRISFAVTSQAQVALQFRTFAPDGVILMFSLPTTTDYYGIYMTAGTVVFSISAGGSVYAVQTSNLYNNGQWYQLRTVHNPTSVQLSIVSVNQTVQTQPEVKQLTNLNFNLLSLANSGFTIGGQTPGILRGPVSTSFAGSIQNFQHSNALTSALDLQPDSLATGINSSSNVDLTKCFVSVVSGLGFLNTSSYALLLSITSPIQTMSFELATTAPSGVIAYFLLSQNFALTTLFLYIALYNGDIFILFNQGQGIQPAFRSRGNYLSDGMIHKIALDFSFTNSPRMTIDTTETHVGAITMTPFFNLQSNSFYVGGVPSSVGIDATNCPVRISLAGGIRNLQINNGLINFFNPNYLSGNNAQGIYLSGLPTPPTALPPLPYTTLTPPMTTPPPACVVPSPSALLNNSYLSFAGSTNSYVAYSTVGLESFLANAFSVRLSFRALQANGILLYLPGSPTAAPTQYFAIYINGGYIRATMSTNTSSALTKNLQSLYTYNDGKWHEVEVLRVNDFLAVIVAENKDYINNQVSSMTGSTLTVGSSIYLGGVPSTLGSSGYPFDSNNIQVGIKSFQGCISNVSLIYFALQVTVLDTSREQTRQSITPCQLTIASGMYLNSSNSYVRLADSVRVAPVFDIVPTFVFNITFQSSAQTGTLMIAWNNAARFVALLLTLGQVQVFMTTTNGQYFSVSSRAQPSPLSVCDNKPHSAVFTIANTYVTLQIDSYAVETFPFSGTTYSAPLSVPIYLGGLKDPSWNIPGAFNPVPLQGCIQSASVNSQPYYISESSDYQSAVSGCLT